MQRVLVAVLTAGIFVTMPVVGSGVGMLGSSKSQPKITVVYKNLASPTLEELAQKAGDPSNAGIPEPEPSFESQRKEQWI